MLSYYKHFLIIAYIYVAKAIRVYDKRVSLIIYCPVEEISETNLPTLYLFFLKIPKSRDFLMTASSYLKNQTMNWRNCINI